MYKTIPKHLAPQETLTLFLRNIPAESRINEIAYFVASALKSGLFSKAGKISKIDIIALRDVYSQVKEFHAVVTVDNAASGRRAIKRLHGQRFKNKRIEVREYIRRDWHNDRRSNHAYTEDDELYHRRMRDRRRSKKLLSYHEINEGTMQQSDLYMALMQNSEV